MQLSRKDLKLMAKDNLRNKYGGAIVVCLIYALLVGALSSTGIGILLLNSLFTIGLYNAFTVGRTKENYDLSDLFDPFSNEVSNRITLSVLKNIYIFLWSLLFIIPGIIKAYSYAMSEYISYRNPNMNYKDCIDQSRKIMDGHKMEFFILEFSFFGWTLLSLLTFGILEIVYVAPYRYATYTLYFENLYNHSSLGQVEQM